VGGGGLGLDDGVLSEVRESTPRGDLYNILKLSLSIASCTQNTVDGSFNLSETRCVISP